MFKVGVPVWKEFQTSFAYRDFKEYGVIGTYKHRFFSAFDKFDSLESLDRENAELSQRLALIEKEFEIERSRNASAEMQEITRDLANRIREEGGSELARVMSAIPYRVPSNLLPHQQYALALGYFRKQEYEQAAVLFNHLLNLQDDKSYQKGEVQLLSAISWYHLKNFKLSNYYLRQVSKNANQTSALFRTTILWQAIVAKAEGKKGESQRQLTVALARFPHAVESGWINGKRQPAAQTDREPNQAMMHQQELKLQKEKAVEENHETAHDSAPEAHPSSDAEVKKHE